MVGRWKHCSEQFDLPLQGHCVDPNWQRMHCSAVTQLTKGTHGEVGAVDGEVGTVDGGVKAVDGGVKAVDGGAKAVDGGVGTVDGGVGVEG